VVVWDFFHQQYLNMDRTMVISNVMFGFHGEIGGIRWRKTMSDGNQNSGDHSSVEGKVVEIYHYL